MDWMAVVGEKVNLLICSNKHTYTHTRGAHGVNYACALGAALLHLADESLCSSVTSLDVILFAGGF